MKTMSLLKLMQCLHDRANIEQLARRSVVISMLIRRAGGLQLKGLYNT